MKGSNIKPLGPRTVVKVSREDGFDFGFAFNDRNFSDRVLRIYIFSSVPMIESIQSPSVLRVRTLHISSPILAARSPFFYKLFTNGMRESEQRHTTLRINASEEAGLMELLKFMYTNNLTVTTATGVLDVLMAADKFDVASCVRHCNRLLRNLPMTPESVLVYLDLPSTILMTKEFQCLTVAAKQFYAVHYKDITRFQDEILSLPLASVETIIGSDDLRVESEDVVYNFVYKWARAQYPKYLDRSKIIRTRLAKFIRYPYMTQKTLRKLLDCKEFDLAFVEKVITEANSFKAEVTRKQHTDENSNIYHRRFVERAYTFRPVKMVGFEQPHPRLVVYLDLKRDMCASLFPKGTFRSELFAFDGHEFFFHGECAMYKRCSSHRFKLSLGIHDKESEICFVFDYEFAARSTLAKGFVSQCKGKYVCAGNTNEVWYQSLFETEWSSFIGEDSVYFIDDVLHLMVELTYRRK